MRLNRNERELGRRGWRRPRAAGYLGRPGLGFLPGAWARGGGRRGRARRGPGLRWAAGGGGRCPGRGRRSLGAGGRGAGGGPGVPGARVGPSWIGKRRGARGPPGTRGRCPAEGPGRLSPGRRDDKARAKGTSGFSSSSSRHGAWFRAENSISFRRRADCLRGARRADPAADRLREGRTPARAGPPGGARRPASLPRPAAGHGGRGAPRGHVSREPGPETAILTRRSAPGPGWGEAGRGRARGTFKPVAGPLEPALEPFLQAFKGVVGVWLVCFQLTACFSEPFPQDLCLGPENSYSSQKNPSVVT